MSQSLAVDYQIERGAIGIGITHGNGDEVAGKRSSDCSRQGFKAHFSIACTQTLCETSETPCSVATHLRFSPVGIVVAHSKICTLRRGLDRKNAVGSDPTMAIAKQRHARRVQGERFVAIVDHDEIIACAVHFGEGK